jgi:U3 small nucleolar RNA-associated protein 15
MSDPTGSLLWENKTFHNDYIRTVDSSPISPNLFVTGSYDHIIAVWDIRMKYSSYTTTSSSSSSSNSNNNRDKPVMSFHGHDQPISQCMFSPSGSLIIAASGNQIKIWDIIKGG